MLSNTRDFNPPPAYLKSRHLHTCHGMLMRGNGFSPEPFSSLNLSLGVGDSTENVLKNRQHIKNALNINFLVTSRQIHSDKIYCVEKVTEDTEVEGYDSLVTDLPGIGLLIQQADCQAILLHDPLKRVIGAIHCGWKGSTLNIIGSTVELMTLSYGSNPAAIQAVISPSLGPCCAEFTNYKDELPRQFHGYQVKPDYFNFWAISRDQLIEAGLQENSIEIPTTCTVCNLDFFSYRRSKKRGRLTTGRHGSFICLAE